MQETPVQYLGQEDSLEKGKAAHSSTLAWRIPWTEEPGGLQSTGSQRVGHNWVTNTFFFLPISQSCKVPFWQMVYQSSLSTNLCVLMLGPRNNWIPGPMGMWVFCHFVEMAWTKGFLKEACSCFKLFLRLSSLWSWNVRKIWEGGDVHLGMKSLRWF